jgi:UDP-3-O-[3-hydroxymyristoyl] N-acetylglucosamine deacetylase
MDGSSKVFVEMINSAGSKALHAPVRYIRIQKPVQVTSGTSTAQLSPAKNFSIKMNFDANGRLNNQAWSLSFNPEEQSFIYDLANARTFGFYEDAQRLWDAGLAQGASLDNTVVIQDGEIMNAEGLRYDDEFVRHKTLDAIGDLALAGSPLLGQFEGHNSGHGLNNQLLRALFADSSAWCIEEPAHPVLVDL